MQQAEHITESEVDIEKKKQELYSEIDALGIKSDSRINKLKKFLADRKIWHLEEMDYPLRNSYEQYLRGQIRSQIVSFYLKIYDTVKQQHIYQQMQTLNGKRIYEWKYQNKIYFLKYYPEKEIAETFETSYKTNLLVWDFTQNCSEVLKKQIFYTLSRIIANTSMSKAFDTFDKAVATNPGATPLLHSDRGYQYTSKAFRRRILAAGMTQSMSRVARCIDNGPMEGFWGLMKREMYYGKKYKTKEELMLAIEKYIDYYTNKRVQRNLEVLTPLEFHEQKLENVA